MNKLNRRDGFKWVAGGLAASLLGSVEAQGNAGNGGSAERSWTGFREKEGAGASNGVGGSAGGAVASTVGVGQVEAFFSPGDAEGAIVRFIGGAVATLRLAAYSFTSARVVDALIKAKKKGVAVVVVVDHKHNVGMDAEGRGKARAALGALVNAGIDVRTNAQFAIHHDKYIVVDERHVQTGSFNYSMAAAKSNSENVVLIWNNAGVAKAFSETWVNRWAGGVAFKNNY